jgi:Flp pilus assembly protein TadD
VLYAAGKWDEARRTWERMIQLAPDQEEYFRANLGAIAAHQGNRAEAERTLSWLANRPGHSEIARARITGLLGDRERAVELLRQAEQRSMPFTRDLHWDTDFDSLRGYPPYEEWIRPKD